jgi:hypothetical protein
MSWKPITEPELLALLQADEAELDQAEAALWQLIRIPPAKWAQHPHGDEGAGFWAVAVFGLHVVWFNDVEDGFDISSYQRYGLIDEYRADQLTLKHVIRRVSIGIETGSVPGPFRVPPSAR